MNRRAFLRGTAGVSVALPFLESLPERSAWSSEAPPPVFGLFICAANGVVGPKFFPEELGPLTSEGLASAEKATSELSRHAPNLTFLKGLRHPMNGPTGCSHAQGSSMALTARTPQGSGSQAMATGPSADVVIAERVQPGIDPLTLYAGNRRNGYIAERLSFDATGTVRAAVDNPYWLYAELVGLATDRGMTPEAEAAARLLAESRNSVHDLVRDDLQALMSHQRLGSADKQRLQQHFDAIRDMEVTMGEMLDCSLADQDIPALEALETGFAFKSDGMIEDLVKFHMGLVATAFACNFSRTATLQWGDGTDQTRYAVPANTELGNWPFHHISHRVQSDSASDNNPVAEQAHAEIDALRMRTLAVGLDHFAARGLENSSFVLWTNHIADGPSHNYRNLPTMIWGNAGGYLKQGQYIDLGTTVTNQLFNTLISAAVRDTGTVVEDFGEGTAGQLDALRA